MTEQKIYACVNKLALLSKKLPKDGMALPLFEQPVLPGGTPCISPRVNRAQSRTQRRAYMVFLPPHNRRQNRMKLKP